MLSLKKITIISTICATALFGAPTPFSSFDTDGNGYISETEFYQTQARNMEQRASENRMMKNAANAPQFSDVDADGDGKITEMEHLRFQNQRMSEMKNNKQQGMSKCGGQGQGMGQGRQ